MQQAQPATLRVAAQLLVLFGELRTSVTANIVDGTWVSASVTAAAALDVLAPADGERGAGGRASVCRDAVR